MKRQPGATVEKQCEECGTTIWAVPTRQNRKRFCSHSCKMKWRWANDPWEMTGMVRPPGHNAPKTLRMCEHCHKPYQPNGTKQRWCPDCVPTKSARGRMIRFGVSLPEWEAMVAEQEGLCFLCREHPATMMDHCHASGLNRRPLCSGCNSALGRFELPGWKEKAEAYVTVS